MSSDHTESVPTSGLLKAVKPANSSLVHQFITIIELAFSGTLAILFTLLSLVLAFC